MKSAVVFAIVAAFVAAEVPSNSYLPPPNRGYPQSEPEVIAARTADHGHDHAQGHSDQLGAVGVNGFARTSIQNQGAISGQLSPQPRFEGRNEQPGDNAASFTRTALQDGSSRLGFEAEKRGFKPQISYEDSENIAHPGYGNANLGNGYRSNGNGYSDNGNGYSDNGNGYSDNGNGYRSNGNEQNGGRSIARANNGHD